MACDFSPNIQWMTKFLWLVKYLLSLLIIYDEKFVELKLFIILTNSPKNMRRLFFICLIILPLLSYSQVKKI